MKEDMTVWDEACFEKRTNYSLLFLKSLTLLKPLSLITVHGPSKLTLNTQVREGVVNWREGNRSEKCSDTGWFDSS